MKILSLDVSSTTIGWALFTFMAESNKIKLVKYGNIKPPKKEKCFLIKLQETKKMFLELLDEWQPDEVIIEDIVQYMPGKSSANSIITLAVYNRTLALTAFEYTGKLPNFMNVLSIRHQLKLNKIFPKKEEMPTLIEKHLNIKLPVMLKRTGKIRDEYYDQSDGIAVGLAWLKKTYKI